MSKKKSNVTGKFTSRFSEEQKRQALSDIVRGMTRAEVARRLGCSTEALRLWWKDASQAGSIPVINNAPSVPANNDSAVPAGPSAAPPPEDGPCLPDSVTADVSTTPATTTAPHDPAHGLSAPEAQAVLELKKEHPAMGPAQIRAQLKRFKGWRLSVKAIARLLKRNGYELEHRGSKPKDFEPQRFEAPHRNALWQLDFLELRLSTLKLFVLLIIDDFSRFLVAHRILEQPASEAVVQTISRAICLHGKPEAVYTDRAGAFLAWRDQSSFQAFLEKHLIDHHVGRAYHPQGRGKVEALIRTIHKELWEVRHFNNTTELRDALEQFALRYNFHRAHLGIDGLTPADRYFGRWPRILDHINALSRKRNDAASLCGGHTALIEEPSEQYAPLELIRLMVHQGRLEIRFFGHRVVLGKLEE